MYMYIYIYYIYIYFFFFFFAIHFLLEPCKKNCVYCSASNLLQVDDNSVIIMMPSLSASGPDLPLVLSNKLLDYHFDFDFTNMHDDGTEFYRGGHHYYRPYGWRRIALKVAGKYENDTWLGTGNYYVYASRLT